MIDFAHMHATSDGAFTDSAMFAEVLKRADEVLEPGAPFHIHFSDIAFANRNETKHLPYGEGTLRAEPLAEALAPFERPATVISESPGRGVESGDQGDPVGYEEGVKPTSARSSKLSSLVASSPRPRSRRNLSSWNMVSTWLRLWSVSTTVACASRRSCSASSSRP